MAREIHQPRTCQANNGEQTLGQVRRRRERCKWAKRRTANKRHRLARATDVTKMLSDWAKCSQCGEKRAQRFHAWTAPTTEPVLTLSNRRRQRASKAEGGGARLRASAQPDLEPADKM
eukprot:6974500-Karenia_brevis.AAC.1